MDGPQVLLSDIDYNLSNCGTSEELALGRVKCVGKVGALGTHGPRFEIKMKQDVVWDITHPPNGNTNPLGSQETVPQTSHTSKEPRVEEEPTAAPLSPPPPPPCPPPAKLKTGCVDVETLLAQHSSSI